MKVNSLTSLKFFRSLDIGDCQLTDKCVGSIREIIHRKENQSGKKNALLLHVKFELKFFFVI
jgi:hypothetical protein